MTVTRKVLLAFAIISAGFGVFALFASFLGQATSQARTEAEAVYAVIRDAVAEEIDATRSRLETLASAPGILDDDPDVCSALLKDMLVKNAARNDVFLRIRPDGELDCTPGGAASVDLSERLYFREALETKEFVVGEFLVGKVSAEPVLAVSLPVLSAAGGVSAVLVAGVKTDWLEAIVQRVSRDGALLVEVQDSSGVLLSYFLEPNLGVTTSDRRTELIRLPLLPDRSVAQVVIFERT